MRITAVITLALLSTLPACGEDSKEPITSEHGRWQVLSATRDRRPTGLLDEAYFEFDTAQQVLTTNLTGEELKLTYAFNQERDRVGLTGSAVLTDLEVVTLNDTALTLQTVMMEVPFTLRLGRGPE